MATRWGIVSSGKICHDFVTILRSLPQNEHQVVAVAARRLEDAQKFAKLHNIPKAYDSYEKLANDPDVEIAYIGSINPQHFPIGKLFLNAGKHVLMEKPMAMNLKETEELLKIAKQKKVFLMEAVWSRFFPVYKQVVQEISSGSIGDVKYANATFGNRLSGIDRLSKKELGGGTILDIGVYALNAICVAFGGKTPEKISAYGSLNEDGVDESMAAVLKYSDGGLATVSTSSLVCYPCECEIVGTKGTLKIKYPMWCPTELVTPTKTHTFPLPETILPCNFSNSSGLRYEAMEIRECLKKGLLECPLMTHNDTRLLASIMDEIRKQVGVVYPQD